MKRKMPASAWKPGTSGNPRGKPRGARNKATMAVLALMETGATDIVKAVVEAAKNGDIGAARLVLDRLAPPARDRAIAIELPDASTAAGVAEASKVVLEAVAAGDITPGEAATLTGILEVRRKVIETQDLEHRVAVLESKGG